MLFLSCFDLSSKGFCCFNAIGSAVAGSHYISSVVPVNSCLHISTITNIKPPAFFRIKNIYEVHKKSDLRVAFVSAPDRS